MNLLYGLSELQMQDVYNEVLYHESLDEIRSRLYEGTYGEGMKAKGIKPLTEAEIHEAAKWLQTNLLNYTYWTDGAEDAIDNVIANRPLKEATKPLCQYDKMLAEYGLKPHDEFMVANVLGFTDTLYVFNETGRLCYYNFAGETFQPSGHDLADFLIRVSPRDIVRTSLADFIRSKEKPKSPFNDTLKTIGLETNQFFRINDDEFGGDDFYIDSFGDVYIINGDPSIPDSRDPDTDEQHEYLTLGRILTQYYDKIVPWDIKATGYA